ncbi:unnamed protein product [Cochlearia groenlandica]
MHGHKNIGLGLVPLMDTWSRLDGLTLFLWRSLGQMMIDWFGFVLAINLAECDRGLGFWPSMDDVWLHTLLMLGRDFDDHGGFVLLGTLAESEGLVLTSSFLVL